MSMFLLPSKFKLWIKFFGFKATFNKSVVEYEFEHFTRNKIIISSFDILWATNKNAWN